MKNLEKDILEKFTTFKKVFEKTITLVEKIVAESIAEKKNEKKIREDLELIKSYINETEQKLNKVKNKLDTK